MPLSNKKPSFPAPPPAPPKGSRSVAAAADEIIVPIFSDAKKIFKPDFMSLEHEKAGAFLHEKHRGLLEEMVERAGQQESIDPENMSREEKAVWWRFVGTAGAAGVWGMGLDYALWLADDSADEFPGFTDEATQGWIWAVWASAQVGGSGDETPPMDTVGAVADLYFQIKLAQEVHFV